MFTELQHKCHDVLLVSVQYDARQSRKLKIQREFGDMWATTRKNPLLQDACPLEKNSWLSVNERGGVAAFRGVLFRNVFRDFL
jgi:hypothetical protein